MPRDSNIPLFLWITTALVAHLAWGGGATRLSKIIEETLDIRRFAQTVQQHVRGGTGPVEVSLLEEQETPPAPEAESETDAPKSEEAEDDEPVPPEVEPPKPEKKAEAAKETPKPEPEKEPPPKLEIVEKKKETPKQELKLDPKKRIAVVQHVDDPKQEDNPDAEFIADQANKVAQQTQARITSTDRNDKNPTPGGNHSSASDAPGNAEETRVAQSEDRPGEADRAPDPEPPPPASKPAEEAAAASGSRPKPEKVAMRTAPERAQAAREATKAQEAAPDLATAGAGASSVATPREARSEQKARKKKKRLPPPKRGSNDAMLGLGSLGTTKSGVNLNLSPKMAIAAIGQDRLVQERKRDAERRKSAHRGSWKSLGIERWRSAIENYVPSVKPGNQTALNTARVPFASYLNTIHNRLHPIFADSFLGSLDSLPGSHPMNRPDIKTHLEIVLSQEDGRVVRMGVTHTSGVTAFDIAALESVQRASPYGTPPREIVSPDGNVYFHWEFHRNPYYACSTYFARPYMLKVQPGTAPPKVAPPDDSPKHDDGPPSDDRRHGLLPLAPLLEKRASLR